MATSMEQLCNLEPSADSVSLEPSVSDLRPWNTGFDTRPDTRRTCILIGTSCCEVEAGVHDDSSSCGYSAPDPCDVNVGPEIGQGHVSH